MLISPLALRARHQLARNAETCAGAKILHHAPADVVLLRLGGNRERSALRLVEDAGFLGPRALLERLHGSDRTLAELAIDDAVVVAGPDQIVLDGDALTSGIAV